MRFFRNQPLRLKLLFIALITTLISMALVMVGIIFYELSTYRDRLTKELTDAGAFIAANSAPSIAFNDPQTAHDILATLRSSPAITGAALYTKDGHIFAFYIRQDQENYIFPDQPSDGGGRFASQQLEIVQRVEQKSHPLGTLYLRAETTFVYSRLKGYAGILLIVSMALGGGAILLHRMLRRLVSEPLVRLSQITEKIADGDLSVQVPTVNNDELGQLGRSFNRMTSELASLYRGIKRSEEVYRTIARSIPDGGVLVFDQNLHCVVSEGSLLKELGFTTGPEAEGRSAEEMFPGEDLALNRARIWQALHGKSESYEMTFRDRELWSQYVPLSDPASGRPAGVMLLTLDITHRKLAEEEIRTLNEELEARVEQRTAELNATIKELESFSYSISHDLRAPLRAMQSFASIAIEEKGDMLDDEGKRYLGIIKKNSLYMGKLVDELLNFSSLGRQNVEFGPLDMEKLVCSVAETPEFQHSHPQMDLCVDPLPRALGSEPLIREVIANLISNALKYSRSGPTVRIEIGAKSHGYENIYFIRDQGIGFEMEYADKIFGVFQRLHGPEEYEGTGIGLALVKRIIERHGGNVWAESEPGKGATFYFSLMAVEG